MNFWKGGMKKVLESSWGNYSTSSGIRVGGSHGVKATFWLDVPKIKKWGNNSMRSLGTARKDELLETNYVVIQI